MASAISAISSAVSSTSDSTGLGGSAPSEQMFLQLLVAQLQNQDPLDPADSTQFVSELAQFSELEQVIAIRGDIEAQAASGTTASSTQTTSTTTSGDGQTSTSSPISS